MIGLPDSRIAENTEKIANLSFLMQVYVKGFPVSMCLSDGNKTGNAEKEKRHAKETAGNDAARMSIA